MTVVLMSYKSNALVLARPYNLRSIASYAARDKPSADLHFGTLQLFSRKLFYLHPFFLPAFATPT